MGVMKLADAAKRTAKRKGSGLTPTEPATEMAMGAKIMAVALLDMTELKSTVSR